VIALQEDQTGRRVQSMFSVSNAWKERAASALQNYTSFFVSWGKHHRSQN
jgi:hypothetical protein